MFDAQAKVAEDGRRFISLPHSNRIYEGDWGYMTNSMGKNGQRIGHYSVPLDEWAKNGLRVLQHQAISEALGRIFQGINRLKAVFPHREFTIDGRLVGDIGEVIAARDYDIELDKKGQADHDGETSDKRRVQIKATFQDSLTFKTIPDLYLGLKLSIDGTYEEVFNGPGKIIFQRYSHRKSIGKQQLSFPVLELKNLSRKVPDNQRIRKRTSG